MTDLSEYDFPFEGLEERVVRWAEEAVMLRHGPVEDPEGPLGGVPITDVVGVLNYLARLQQRIWRCDQLLVFVTQAKGRAKRAQDEAKFTAELAVYTATQRNAASRTQAFVTREERVADAALDAFEERRASHRAERLVSVTSEAYEVVRSVHWQLDALRKDTRAVLHALQFDAALEH